MATVLELQHRPFSEYSGLISFRTEWFDLLAVQRLSPDGEAEPPILRPPNAKRLFTGKDLDAGKN